MKIFLLITILAAGMFASMPGRAIGQGSPVGKWVLDKGLLESEMLDKDQKVLELMPPEKRAEVLREMGSKEFGFFQDGSFEAHYSFMGAPAQVEGNWSLDGNGQLNIETGGIVRTYTMETISSERLVLVPKEKSGLMVKLVFNKTEQP